MRSLPCQDLRDEVTALMDTREHLVEAGKSTSLIDLQIAKANARLQDCLRHHHGPITSEAPSSTTLLVGAIGASLLQSAEPGLPKALQTFLDDWYCGTPPRPGWPPRGDVLQAVSDLVQLTLQLPEVSAIRVRVGEVASYLTRLSTVGTQAAKVGR